MNLTIKEFPNSPTLFSGDTMAWVEFRDEKSDLDLFILFMPGDRAFLISRRGDSDFQETAKNFGIEMRSPGSSRITVFHSPFVKSFESDQATWAEILDPAGRLALFCVSMPGESPRLYDRQDEPTFFQALRSLRG